MKSNKEYRFEDNPEEKLFHDKFIETFGKDNSSRVTLSAMIFGWENNRQTYPKKWLNQEQENICLNLIQWLDSPVGQGFLADCGYIKK